MNDDLKFRSSVLIGGGWVSCLESYEQIVGLMNEAQPMATKIEGKEVPDDFPLSWAWNWQPIELNIGGISDPGATDVRVYRACVQPNSLQAVVEIPLDQQMDVKVGEDADAG